MRLSRRLEVEELVEGRCNRRLPHLRLGRGLQAEVRLSVVRRDCVGFGAVLGFDLLVVYGRLLRLG